MGFYLLFIILSFIPSFWLAFHKNFFIIPNQKFDVYLVRLIFSVSLMMATITLSIFLYIFALFFIRDICQSLSQIFEYSGLLLPLFSSILVIFLVKVFLLRKDLPSSKDPDFFNYCLYIYMPNKVLHGGNLNKSLNIDMNVRFMHIVQLVFTAGRYNDCHDIELFDVLCTDHGELIFSQKAVEIFSEKIPNSFSSKLLTVDSMDISKQFYLVTPFHVMDKMDSMTKFKKSGFLANELFVKDNQIFYSKKSFDNAHDLNLSEECVGSNTGLPYFSQNFIIISNKVMKMLINEFGQHKDDFIPVHCSENSGMISDSMTNDNAGNSSENLQGGFHETDQRCEKFQAGNDYSGIRFLRNILAVLKGNRIHETNEILIYVDTLAIFLGIPVILWKHILFSGKRKTEQLTG